MLSYATFGKKINTSSKSGKVNFTRGKYVSRASEKLTANQQASFRLKKILESYSAFGVSEKLRQNWASEMSDMKTLSTMNMELTASALVFLMKFNGNVTPENFNPTNIEEVMFRIIPVGSDYQPYASDLLRYIRAISYFRASKQN